MSFTFTNEDGEVVETIVRCVNCTFIQTRRHFGDDEFCPLCQECGVEQIGSQSKTKGLTEFQYRTLLDQVEEQCSGVGSSTIESIETEFENGQDFLDACRDAVNGFEWDRLTVVSGVGESTAKTIATEVAEMRDWETKTLIL